MAEAHQYQLEVLSEKHRSDRVKLLIDTFKMSAEFLEWKYDWNPNLDQSLVAVAINNEQVVGCVNWLPRSLKISKSLSVRTALGADLAVHQDHRGHGLSKRLIASEDTFLEGKNIVMSYGFASSELVAHVHGPLIGVVAVPTSTVVYKKYLNMSEIRNKVEEMDRIAKSNEKMKRKLTDLDMRVSFRLRGKPAFTIEIGPDGIRLQENDLTRPDLRLECDLTFFDLFKSKIKTLALIKALLTRKIRIKGSLKKAIKLYSISKLLRMLIT